jgi:hypothetical protein
MFFYNFLLLVFCSRVINGIGWQGNMRQSFADAGGKGKICRF